MSASNSARTHPHTQIMDGQLYIRRRLYSWWEKQLTRPLKNTLCKKCHCCLPAYAAIQPIFDQSNYMRNHIVFNTILMSYDYIGVKQWWKTTDIFHLVKVAIPQYDSVKTKVLHLNSYSKPPNKSLSMRKCSKSTHWCVHYFKSWG